jgi:hypothetical protein
LPHELNRSDGVPLPDGPASDDGSVGDGHAARDGVSEVDTVVVRGASSPWGWPIDRWRSAPSGRSPALQ